MTDAIWTTQDQEGLAAMGLQSLDQLGRQSAKIATLAEKRTAFDALHKQWAETQDEAFGQQLEDLHYEIEGIEHEIDEATNRRECPTCGRWTVKETITPTKNYGGGWDTFSECMRPACDYKDVAV